MENENTEKLKEKPEKISKEEYESKVVELAKQGLTAEKIGEKLRQEKIHPSEFKTKISRILKKEKMYTSPDLKNIEAKLEGLNKHCAVNKQDKRAIREKERIFSQTRKTKKYLKL